MIITNTINRYHMFKIDKKKTKKTKHRNIYETLPNLPTLRNVGGSSRILELCTRKKGHFIYLLKLKERCSFLPFFLFYSLISEICKLTEFTFRSKKYIEIHSSPFPHELASENLHYHPHGLQLFGFTFIIVNVSNLPSQIY